MILSPSADGETLPRAFPLGKGLEVFSQRDTSRPFYISPKFFLHHHIISVECKIFFTPAISH